MSHQQLFNQGSWEGEVDLGDGQLH